MSSRGMSWVRTNRSSSPAIVAGASRYTRSSSPEKSAPVHAMGSCVCSVRIAVGTSGLLVDGDLAESSHLRTGRLRHEPDVRPRAHEPEPEADELGEQLLVADAGDAEDHVVLAARLRDGARRIEERRIAEVTQDPHLRGE